MAQAAGIPRAVDLWLQLPTDVNQPSYAQKVRLFAQNVCSQLNEIRGTYSSTPAYWSAPTANGVVGQALLSGGTGLPTWFAATQGGVIWGSGTSGILAASAAGTTGQAMLSGGTGAPTWFAATQGGVLWGSGANGILAASAAGTTGQAMISGGTGAPTWFAATQGGVLWGSGANGILAASAAGVAGQAMLSGGTGAPTWFSPAQGGILCGGAGGAMANSAAGASGQVVTSGGTGVPTFTDKDSANTANALVQRDANGDFTTRDVSGRKVILTGAALLGSTADSTNGALYYDSTIQTEIARLPGLISRRVGVVCIQTQQGSVSNTVTETTLLNLAAGDGSVTFAAGSWSVGKTIRVTMAGFISTRAAYAGDTLRLDLQSNNNGTVIQSTLTGAELIASMSLRPYEFEVTMVIRTLGAGGTNFQTGKLILVQAGGSSAVTTHYLGITAGAWNTTLGDIFDFKATWSVADTGNIATCDKFILEVLS